MLNKKTRKPKDTESVKQDKKSKARAPKTAGVENVRRAAPETDGSGDINALINRLLSAIDGISALFERETQALKSADTDGFFALQDEKLTVAKEYQVSAQKLLNRSDEAKAADPDLQSKLEKARKGFGEIMEKNHQALERMQRTTSRLSDRIRNTARDEMQRESSFSYGQSGAMHGSERKIISTGIIETA